MKPSWNYQQCTYYVPCTIVGVEGDEISVCRLWLETDHSIQGVALTSFTFVLVQLHGGTRLECKSVVLDFFFGSNEPQEWADRGQHALSNVVPGQYVRPPYRDVYRTRNH